jgi:Tol biopolymer transport system component
LALDVALSPAKDKVAFVGYLGNKTRNGDLDTLDIASGVMTATAPSDTYSPISNPQWSPDGTSLSFTANGPHNQGGIFVVQADSEPVHVASGYEATWSPDGSKLAVLDSVHGNSRIKIVDLKDGTARTIFVPQTGSREYISSLDWSPSAQSLAFTMSSQQNGYRVGRLYRIDQDGSNLKVLVSDPGGKSAASPKWLLDEKWVAFLQIDGVDLTLNFVRSDGQCIVSPLKNLNTIMSVDISRDGTTAIFELDNGLYMLDIPAALKPQSLNTVLTCD